MPGNVIIIGFNHASYVKKYYKVENCTNLKRVLIIDVKIKQRDEQAMPLSSGNLAEPMLKVSIC